MLLEKAMNALNKVRLLTPGPTEIPDRVRLAMANPMIHHRKPEFVKILQETQTLLQELFGTKEVVLPLACSGTGAMTAAVHNLFNVGEKVLVINAGKFGERWAKISQTHNLDVVEHVIPWGEAITAPILEDLLNTYNDVKGVFIQISETSTGAQMPVQELAKVTQSKNVLLIADGISAIGIAPCPMDEWGVDCLLTGSQKGLMLPPGLALISLSAKAWKKAESVKSNCFYFNLLKEKESCLKNQTLFTSPVSLICGLHEALTMLLQDGLEAIYKKQWALTQMTRQAVQELGFELAAKEHFAWGVTGLFMPNGLDSKPVVKNMYDKYNVIVTQGQPPMAAEMMRIGHMGWVDYADITAGLYALSKSMEEVYEIKAPEGVIERALDLYFSLA